MATTLRSIGAGTALALAILLFSTGVLAPYLPQEISRPAWRGAIVLASDGAAPLRVKNGHGAVRVATWEHPHIGVEAALRVYAYGFQTSAAAAAFGESAIRSGMDSGDFVVSAAVPPAGLSLRSELSISVPQGTALHIENEAGTIRIGTGCGSVTARGINADMLLYAPEGPVDLETVSGRILLLDSAAGGKVETLDGSVYARLRGGSLDARTGNGDIGVTLLEPAVERCSLTSANGAITLVLAAACRAEITAETGLGALSSLLKTTPALPPGAHTRAWSGVVAGSAAPPPGEGPICRVTMRTRNGNISIREGG